MLPWVGQIEAKILAQSSYRCELFQCLGIVIQWDLHDDKTIIAGEGSSIFSCCIAFSFSSEPYNFMTTTFNLDSMRVGDNVLCVTIHADEVECICHI